LRYLAYFLITKAEKNLKMGDLPPLMNVVLPVYVMRKWCMSNGYSNKIERIKVTTIKKVNEK